MNCVDILPLRANFQMTQVTRQRSRILNPNYKAVGDQNVAAGRETTQRGWYEFAAGFVAGQHVLDVGCGLGEGVEILGQKAQRAEGIDLDHRLAKPDITVRDIAKVPSKAVDAVVCIDVIEHVEDDYTFIGHLARVARRQVLLSTPNYTATRCTWPYHVREYMPHELVSLLSPYGDVELYRGSHFGDQRYVVKHLNGYLLLNRLRTANVVTGFAARCLNQCLPVRARIHNHLFARVSLS